jgi:EAL domain-containing protein (putative c-di-GMP-specific phosphodiesterase class I)/GGDEF domain-containing protein
MRTKGITNVKSDNHYSSNCLKNIFVYDKGAMRETTEGLTVQSTSGWDRLSILSLIDNNDFEAVLQPIYSANTGSVYGFESLIRVKSKPTANIAQLFATAQKEKLISTLDVACRHYALKKASSEGLRKENCLIFINICPETLMDPAYRTGITDDLAEEYGVPKEAIVIEITEESAIHNYELFTQAVFYYKQQGYKIAIDDFGSGYGGLKMLSIIEPDFVKIDRHFISRIDSAMVKFNLVDSISLACNRLGIRLIAEGIERKEELETVLNLGIELLQGHYLAKPSSQAAFNIIALPGIGPSRKIPAGDMAGLCFIDEIVSYDRTIGPDARINHVYEIFLSDSRLRSLPVITNGVVIGLLHRSRFLEKCVLGRFGYGMHINAKKKAAELMEQPSIVVDHKTTLEEVSERIQKRHSDLTYDDILVTQNGRFLGVVAVSDMLNAMTRRSIMLAKGANPLTGLPGNEFIRNEIERRLFQGRNFGVCYIDINYFKPYNDHYGFEKGDKALMALAESIRKAAGHGDSDTFVGHIGGDDFIIVCRHHISERLASGVIDNFNLCLPVLHGEHDFRGGHYTAVNRSGNQEIFGLLSLSIGIVNTNLHKIDSYAHLASIASEVKKAAKLKSLSTGSSVIVVDKRVFSPS